MSNLEAVYSKALAADLREAVRMAADWYVRLQSGAQSESVGEHVVNKQSINKQSINKQWSEWLAASPLHRQAWQQVQAVQDHCAQVPGQIASPILYESGLSRRQLLRNLAGIAIIAPTAWVAYRTIPWVEWQADYRTAVGERRQLMLADGSELIVNTNSAVDVRFTVEQRLLHLHEGEILIQTASDNVSRARPFLINTRHGQVQALGTRFTVRITEHSTHVAVLQDSVRVSPVNIAKSDNILLRAGEQLSFDRNSTSDIMAADTSVGSWAGGSLIVVDMPLETLLTELARYRPGILSCDPAVASLKISGAFPLDDTDLALKVLTDAFPLHQSRLTRYWVRIAPV